ncbi:GABA transporter 1 [Linum perenne]
MGTAAPPVSADSKLHEDGGTSSGGGMQQQKVAELDAGALFVLKSKGSWAHCGYHLTTSIVAPPLLSLPFAFTLLGWGGGVVCLVVAAAVTFYNYNLLSLVLEHHAHLGNRLFRFRDMANLILGPKWARYYVGPIQFIVCYGAVVACILLGGQCMKAIYLLSNPNGKLKLYLFITIFGCFMLTLAQIPSFHSLRHINLISLLLTLAYSACATAAAVHIGHHRSSSAAASYSLPGDNTQDRLFGVFNAVAIIATTYGNGIIPEIQATVAPPVKGKMFKGLCVCYAVILATFFSVAISGYWAFGNEAHGLVLSNFVVDGKALVPKWFVLMTNVFTVLQLCAVAVESLFGDPKREQFSARNVVPRILSRSASVVLATTLAAMLPFFGDINAIIGAFGFIPLDFILPLVFYNLTFKPSKRSLVFWLNSVIAFVFAVVGAIAAVAAVRQIGLDANTYRLFANV